MSKQPVLEDDIIDAWASKDAAKFAILLRDYEKGANVIVAWQKMENQITFSH